MVRKKNIFKHLTQKKKGISLLEVIVATALFVVIMVMVSGVFASFYKTLVAARAEQRSMEDANNAVNLMAKVLRTSKIKDFPASHDRIVAWDYSEISNEKCYVFAFDGTRMIGGRYTSINDESLCTNAATVLSEFAVDGVTGLFDTDSNSNVANIKRITIQVNSNKTGNITPTSLQTSVYLRN